MSYKYNMWGASTEMLFIPHLSFSMLKPKFTAILKCYTMQWVNLPQGLSRAMCFPVGDPYIQTSCSLRGRLEYTPLGLDGYLSMDSNGELFKWRIAPYSQSRYFWKHINNISMHSLTCCAKMDSQIYVIHHKTRNISLELLYNPSWWHPCWLRY